MTRQQQEEFPIGGSKESKSIDTSTFKSWPNSNWQFGRKNQWLLDKHKTAEQNRWIDEALDLPNSPVPIYMKIGKEHLNIH